MSDKDKYKKYEGIINKATLAAGAIGAPGAFSFGLDVSVMTGIWGTMIVAIAEKSGREMDKTTAAKIASGVAAGVAAYIAGSKLAVNVIRFIPGPGTLAAMAANTGLNAWYTRSLGHVLVDMFEREEFELTDVGSAVYVILEAMVGEKIARQVTKAMFGSPY
jgi:uncharacterized protein (DUF697 family)